MLPAGGHKWSICGLPITKRTNMQRDYVVSQGITKYTAEYRRELINSLWVAARITARRPCCRTSFKQLIVIIDRTARSMQNTRAISSAKLVEPEVEQKTRTNEHQLPWTCENSMRFACSRYSSQGHKLEKFKQINLTNHACFDNPDLWST